MLRLPRPLLFALWCCLAFQPAASADQVVTSDDVTSRVVVRVTPSSSSASQGELRPGQQAELLGSVPNWYHVQLSNGVEGFVAKRWTRVRTDTPIVAHTSPTFVLDVVDVGTGLAVFVRGPDFTLIYDGGSNDDDSIGANNRLLAYLKAAAPSMTTINHVVLSHPHTDHVLLLPDLFDTYAIQHVWDSGRLHDVCGYRAFLTAVRDEAGVKYHTPRFGFVTRPYDFAAKQCGRDALPATTIQVPHDSLIDTDELPLGQHASMRILRADVKDTGSPNGNSVVVRLDFGETRVLLMGDAEAGGRQPVSTVPTPRSIEGVLLACCRDDLAARILVVGHHGSLTSSRRAFLDAVAASTYIVSSGPKPYSGHVLPDTAVLSELKARGDLYRTDVRDDLCGTRTDKVGPPADGRPGGCDHVRATIPFTGRPIVAALQQIQPATPTLLPGIPAQEEPPPPAGGKSTDASPERRQVGVAPVTFLVPLLAFAWLILQEWHRGLNRRRIAEAVAGAAPAWIMERSEVQALIHKEARRVWSTLAPTVDEVFEDAAAQRITERLGTHAQSVDPSTNQEAAATPDPTLKAAHTALLARIDHPTQLRPSPALAFLVIAAVVIVLFVFVPQSLPAESQGQLGSVIWDDALAGLAASGLGSVAAWATRRGNREMQLRANAETGQTHSPRFQQVLYGTSEMLDKPKLALPRKHKTAAEESPNDQ